MIKTNVQILKETRIFLEEANANRAPYIINSGAFSKPKKLTFTLVILFLLNLPKRSLSMELEDFYKQLLPASVPCTKSAISQARYKLKHEFFIDWNKALVASYYTENDERIDSWEDYQLQGIDGTTVHLMDTEEIRTTFGCQPNQSTNVPMARVVNRFDVLNRIIIDAVIAPIGKGETTLAIAQLDQVAEDVISIYDRNFTSFEFMYEHFCRNLHFIIRSKLDFNNVVKDFVSSGQNMAIVEFNATSTAIKNLKTRGIELTKEDQIKVRLVRVELDNGVTEVLITSLMDEEAFPNEDFKELYNYRWGTETSFDNLKNKLQLGAFSGHGPEAIYQDFHVAVFMANLNEILIKDCAEKVQELTKERIHDYAVNRNVSIGLMKHQVVKLFFLDTEQMPSILKTIKASFLRYLEPVRPGRTFVRLFKSRARRCKFHTVTNYRRAI